MSRNAAATAARQLVARTIEVDPATRIDLVRVAGDRGFLFENERVALAGRGVALRLHLPDGMDGAGELAATALAAIDTTGAPGPPPVAFGALPFDRRRPGTLVVPEVVARRDEWGRQWLTTIDDRPVEPRLAASAPHERPDALPDGFTLRSPVPHSEWMALVADAVAAIEAGAFEKVVLAREVVVEANRPVVVSDVVRRLRSLYPSCTVFSVEGFVGASPELLVSRRGDVIRSHPLAGTHGRSGDPDVDERLAAALMGSDKDRREHGVLVGAIARVLREVCTELDVPAAPSILPLRNVLHLATELRGRLGAAAPDALSLAERLHPTPAVGGAPRDAALAWLARNERLDRSRYAGPAGWVDANGDGDFVVGIRSAEIDGHRARLFAGSGVVAGSDPYAELVETQLKLQALLAALVRP